MVFVQEDPEDLVDLVHAAYSVLATFHSQCSQRLFRKPKAVLSAMKGVVQAFDRARLRKLAKTWTLNVEEYSVVRKTAQKRDALAYAYFNYAAGQKKTAKEVSELTRAARKCGEALRRGGGLGVTVTLIPLELPIPHQRRKENRESALVRGPECSTSMHTSRPRRDSLHRDFRRSKQ